MKNTEPIRIAVVGCGAVSELYYAPVLIETSQLGSTSVEMLFDPDAERTATLKEFFPDAAITSDFADILRFSPDLVIVASPPRFHAEQTIALLNQGAAVLCEKPMAATVVEAEAMVAASANSKSVLAVGLFRRFFPTSRMIYEIVRNGRLGAVKHYEVSEGGPFNWPAQSASFFQKSGSQGGVLADLGVHVLDLLIWWFGSPKRVVYEDDAMGGLEANCVIKLGFENGISGTVRLSRDTRLANRTIIECEQGWLRYNAASANELEIGFPDLDLSMNGQLMQVGDSGAAGYRSNLALSYSQAFAKQASNVIASMRGDEDLLVPGEQGLPTMQLIDQCYSERSLMNMPWLAKSELQMARSLGTKFGYRSGQI